VIKLTPRTHRERHAEHQVQLFADLVATGHRPWRLWVNAIPDLFLLILSFPRRTAMSELARVALFPLSILNAVSGIVLVVTALITSGVPAWVAVPASALAAQGLFTLAWLTDRAPLAPRNANVLLAFGEAAALIIGAVGLVAMLIGQSGTSDPEYGPPTMLVLITVHAIVGLLAPPNQSTSPLPTS